MLHEQRIVIIDFDDPILFRNKYEKEFKDKVMNKRITVIIRVRDNQFNEVPFDIQKKAIKLTLSTEDIFPNIHSEVLRSIPKRLYSEIDSVYPHCLFASEDETLDCLLLELFSINIHAIVDERSIVSSALNYFEQTAIPLPGIFLERLVYVLSQNNALNETLIRELFVSEENLCNFLNHRWTIFIGETLSSNEKQAIAEKKLPYSDELFEDSEIQKHLVKLFNSGKIDTIKVTDSTNFERWMQQGIKEDPQYKVKYIRDKLRELQQDYSEFQMKDWLAFSVDLAVFQTEYQDSLIDLKEWEQQLKNVNKSFKEWMFSKYHQLHSLPPVPKPKMVHQIPHYLSRFSDEKVALLVLDGMNMSQWMMVREVLVNHQLKVDVTPVFSWVPSSTTVSRQSIFSGLKPYEFADSILTTNKESKQWKEFWIENGIPGDYVAYEKSLGLKNYTREELAYNINPSIKVYGAVIDVIDQFIHGARQGNQTVYNEIKTWLQSNYLFNMISDLLDAGFEVFLTSDHGNKECKGIGRLNEGVLVDTKGERMRTYRSKKLRDETAEKQPGTIAWSDVGLPEEFHVLLAKGEGAFTPKNNRIVTHGGISIEEVIVPFVKVSR